MVAILEVEMFGRRSTIYDRVRGWCCRLVGLLERLLTKVEIDEVVLHPLSPNDT